MENYYFLEGDHRRGPFSLDQLKTYPISVDTPIWKDSRNEWMPAEELEELRAFVMAEVVRPVRRKAASGGRRGAGGRRRRLLWLATVLVLVGIVGFYSVPKKGSIYSALPFVDQEHANPMNYLELSGNYHPNFWGTKWVIEGSVANTASHTNYKDLVVKVDYYSRTKTVMYSRAYIVYDYFLFGVKKGFSLVVDKPKAAATCGWTVAGAGVE